MPSLVSIRRFYPMLLLGYWLCNGLVSSTCRSAGENDYHCTTVQRSRRPPSELRGRAVACSHVPF
jgi:hypothetical protein